MNRILSLIISILFSVGVFAQSEFYKTLTEALDNYDYETVITKVNEHLEDYPNDCDALFLRSLAKSGQENFAGALADMNAAVKAWKKTSKIPLYVIYFTRGNLYHALGDSPKALEDYNRSIKADKNQAICYETRGDFYFETLQYALAESDYRIAAKLDPENVSYQINILHCLLLLQKDEQAEEQLLKLVRLYPNNNEVARLNALHCLAKKDYKAAIDAQLLYMEKSGSNDNEALLEAAQYELPYAIKAVSNMIDTSHDKVFWLSTRAKIYYVAGMYKDVLNDLSQAEAKADSVQIVSIYRNMALCYGILQNYYSAATYYTKTISAIETLGITDYPQDILYLERANVYHCLGNYDKAVADCDKALVLSMDHAGSIYYMRGISNEMNKNNDAAFEDYNKSILFDDTDAYSYLKRGKQYLIHRRDTASAMNDFQHVLELDTIAVEGSCRNFALMFLGRHDEAKQWMAKIIESSPDNANSYYDAACLYARMGEYEQAVDYLRQALERGYKSFALINSDDALDPLRDRQDFKDLITRYKQNSITDMLRSL